MPSMKSRSCKRDDAKKRRSMKKLMVYIVENAKWSDRVALMHQHEKAFVLGFYRMGGHRGAKEYQWGAGARERIRSGVGALWRVGRELYQPSNRLRTGL